MKPNLQENGRACSTRGPQLSLWAAPVSSKTHSFRNMQISSILDMTNTHKFHIRNTLLSETCKLSANDNSCYDQHRKFHTLLPLGRNTFKHTLFCQKHYISELKSNCIDIRPECLLVSVDCSLQQAQLMCKRACNMCGSGTLMIIPVLLFYFINKN